MTFFFFFRFILFINIFLLFLFFFHSISLRPTRSDADDDTHVQNILDKFNPGARQLINAGKSYLKSLHGKFISATYILVLLLL